MQIPFILLLTVRELLVIDIKRIIEKYALEIAHAGCSTKPANTVIGLMLLHLAEGMRK